MHGLIIMYEWLLIHNPFKGLFVGRQFKKKIRGYLTNIIVKKKYPAIELSLVPTSSLH